MGVYAAQNVPHVAFTIGRGYVKTQIRNSKVGNQNRSTDYRLNTVPDRGVRFAVIVLVPGFLPARYFSQISRYSCSIDLAKVNVSQALEPCK